MHAVFFFFLPRHSDTLYIDVLPAGYIFNGSPGGKVKRKVCLKNVLHRLAEAALSQTQGLRFKVRRCSSSSNMLMVLNLHLSLLKTFIHLAIVH